MKPIYNNSGRLLAWLEGEYIYDLKGHQLNIFIENNAVFGYNRKYLGCYSSGFFRDKSGYAVAFTPGASVGPILPLTSFPPLPPLHTHPAFPPLPPLPPVLPIERFNWSGLSWNHFVKERGH